MSKRYSGKSFKDSNVMKKAKLTFKPKFSITKNITISSYGKIANNLAKAFKDLGSGFVGLQYSNLC